MSICKLQKHLGHTSVMTTEIYLDYLTADAQERAKQVDPNDAEESAQTTAPSRKSRKDRVVKANKKTIS
ncbi:hypothetical protein [Rhodoblastus sp.]|uniref:hypothetical protein n=1 Tax=Rhodoblastus sp. TaxID=1962975 RepID=UPI003F9C8EEF